ncbi:WD40 repeat domain-containing protein OS=Streptomyces alboniger OX=132473 GN=CP975_08100 PE=4 SV=1 [Streptomyces alboniger]
MAPDPHARAAFKTSSPEARPAAGSAERPQPRQRPRKARRLVVAALVAATVAAGIAVPLALRGGDTHGQPVKVSDVMGVAAHPDQSPPRDLIGAGRVAVSAYYTTKLVKQLNGNAIGTYEWSLLNTATEQYEKTDWAWLDVAPGMRHAAVLERDLPADRIGLVNLATGKVQRWIKVDRSVGSVQFSPDGKRLVATAYLLNPDGLFKDAPYRLNGETVPGPKQTRTGFYVIDAATGKADFAKRPAGKSGQGAPTGGRQDFQWSRDGQLVWEPANNKAGRIFYDATGKEMPAPDQEARQSSPGAIWSPDGNLETGAFVGEGEKIVSEVRNVKTGELAATVPGQQLLAWADNSHLIAWRCHPEHCSPGKGEFRNQLLLVGLDGKTIPLSGFRTANLHDEVRWNPVFTRR